jgi:hypothetical protein
MGGSLLPCRGQGGAPGRTTCRLARPTLTCQPAGNERVREHTSCATRSTLLNGDDTLLAHRNEPGSDRSIREMKQMCKCLVVALLLILGARNARTAEARVDKNVIFGMYSGLALLMDVHYPEKANGYGVIFVSGSGWTGGRRRLPMTPPL